MSIFQDAPASAAAGTGRFLPKFRVAALLGGLSDLLIKRRNRRLVATMRDFDDAQLADIGLSRSDVESALSLPSGDPTRYLIQAQQNPLRGVRRR